MFQNQEMSFSRDWMTKRWGNQIQGHCYFSDMELKRDSEDQLKFSFYKIQCEEYKVISADSSMEPKV